MYVKLSGALDIATAHVVRKPLDAIDGPAIIDLAAVDSLTACGLSELWRVARRTGPHIVTLVNASSIVHRILYLADFDQLFVIVDAQSVYRRHARHGPQLVDLPGHHHIAVQ